MLLLAASAVGGACESTGSAADGGAAHPAPEARSAADVATEEPGPAGTDEAPRTAQPEVVAEESPPPPVPAAESADEPHAGTPPARIESTGISPDVPLRLEGTWTHEPSGVVFAPEAAGFRRVAASRHDREGNNVEIDYRRVADGYPAVVSIYVYPAVLRADGRPTTFDEQFAEEQQAVRSGRSDLRVLGSAAWAQSVEGILGGRGVSGRSELLAFAMRTGGMPVAVRSVLTSIRMDPWSLKYRGTFPEGRAEEGLLRMEELLAALRLPPTGLGEAKPVLEEG